MSSMAGRNHGSACRWSPARRARLDELFLAQMIGRTELNAVTGLEVSEVRTISTFKLSNGPPVDHYRRPWCGLGASPCTGFSTVLWSKSVRGRHCR